MFWYPYTGSVPYALSWSAGLFTTALAITALVGAVRVVLLALRPVSSEIVSVPFEPVAVDDLPEVKQDAA
jgi:hypothetical protein